MVQELPAGTLCLNSAVVTVKWQHSISLQVMSGTDLDTASKKQCAGVVTGGTACGDAEHKANHNGVDTVHVTDTVCGGAEHKANHNGVDTVHVTGAACGDAEHKANHNGVDTVHVTGTVCGDAEHKANHNSVHTVHVTGTVCGDAEHHACHNGVDAEVLGSVEKPPVLVSCSTGATYAAGHVIVTCSLGCLKACCNTMFEPSLPQHMIQVCDSNV
jgi:hypothetical protein